MKKSIIPLLFISATLTSTSLFANYAGPDSTPVVSVAAIKKEPFDDMDVVLVGKITERLSGESYIFTDETGSIQVEIDYENLPSASFDHNTLVRIEGELEVEKRLDRIEIDVDRLELI